MSTNVLPFPGDNAAPAASASAPASTPASQPGISVGHVDPDHPVAYTPPALPDMSAQEPLNPLPSEQPIRDLGAVSKGGGLAYMGDQLLRGYIQGRAVKQARMAINTARQSQGLQGLYNDAAKDYLAMAQSGADPNSPEMRAAAAKKDAAWNAYMTFVGEHVQDQGKQVTNKRTGKTTTQKRSLLERIISPSDPSDIAPAVYEAMQKMGAPVNYQAAPYLTPQYRQQLQQRQDLESSTTQAKTAIAQTQGELATLEAKPNPTEADVARIEQLKGFLQKEPSSAQTWHVLPGSKPYQHGGTGPYFQTMENGLGETTEIPLPAGYAPPLSKTAPKVGTFGDFMVAAYGLHPTPAQYVKGRKLWNSAAGSTTTVGTHMISVPQPDGSIKLVEVETTSTRSPGGASAGAAPTVRQDTNPPSAVSSTPASAPTSVPAGSATHAHTPTQAPVHAPAHVPTSVPAPVAAHASTHASSPAKSGDIIGGRLTAPATKALETYDSLNASYDNAKNYLSDLNPPNSYALTLAYIKAQNLGGTGAIRMNEAEIKRAQSLGSYAQKFRTAFEQGTKGTLPANIASQMVDSIGVMRNGWQKIAENYQAGGGGVLLSPSASSATTAPFNWNSAPLAGTAK